VAHALFRTIHFTLLTANSPESGAISYFYDNGGNSAEGFAIGPIKLAGQHTISYCYDTLTHDCKAYSLAKLPEWTVAARHCCGEPTTMTKVRMRSASLLAH